MDYDCRMKSAVCNQNKAGVCCRNCIEEKCRNRCGNYPTACGMSVRAKEPARNGMPVFLPEDDIGKTNKAWSKAEKDFLIEYNEVLNRQQIADQLGRPLNSVESMARRLGLQGRNRIMPPDPSTYKRADFHQGRFDAGGQTLFEFICPRCRRTLLSGYIRSRTPIVNVRPRAEDLGRKNRKSNRVTCKCGQPVKLWEVRK